MYISLTDLLMNFHLNAFESKISSLTAKINDIIVFLLSYFPLLYAGGLVTDPDLAYQIGWAQCALVGIMFLVNMAVLFKSMISNMIEECRRIRVERYNFRMLKFYGYDMVIVVRSAW